MVSLIDNDNCPHGLSSLGLGDHGRGALIERIYNLRARSLPFAAPQGILQVTEAALVRDVLRVLQGYSTSNLPWDSARRCFYIQSGIHVLHLSQSSLHNLLQSFTRAATSLRRVENFFQRVMKGTSESWRRPISQARPTLEAFANVVHSRLKSLRMIVLRNDIEAASGNAESGVTLLSLFATLSRVFAGAEFLEHVVHVTVPEPEVLYRNEISAGQLAIYILSSLYEELDCFSLLQDAQEDAYETLLLLFVGCLWPLVTSLEAWLREGILSDPAEEVFSYGDKSVPLGDSSFWKSGYRFRNGDISEEERIRSSYRSPGNHKGVARAGPLEGSQSQLPSHSLSVREDPPVDLVCPSFLRPQAKAILYAGKSLQLLQFVRQKHADGDREISLVSGLPPPFLTVNSSSSTHPTRQGSSAFEINICHNNGASDGLPWEHVPLYDQFCALLRTLLGDTSETRSLGSIDVDPGYSYRCFERESFTATNLHCILSEEKGPGSGCYSLMACATEKGGVNEVTNACYGQTVEVNSDTGVNLNRKGEHSPAQNGIERVVGTTFVIDSKLHFPHILERKGWLKLAQYCKIPGLEDDCLRAAIFHPPSALQECILTSMPCAAVGLAALSDQTLKVGGLDTRRGTEQTNREGVLCTGTDFGCGPGCGNTLLLHDRQTVTAVEKLLPYPTLFSCQEQCNVSEKLPCQSSSWTAASILEWIQTTPLKARPASVVVQECLTSLIQKQVDHVGQLLLSKLMGEWRLMEELALLRAIYLVGSGDLLQQFASVLFNKLDRGEPWDDFYELNTMLQESVRSSSHGMVLPGLDSLVVTVLPRASSKREKAPRPLLSPPKKAGRAYSFGSDSLDSLFFTYKVAWPLEIIIDNNAVKEYNQVMVFLLKVKRAKHALDKACRWTWKKGAGDAVLHKQRLLLQQKLMHFVNTLHQYIMDRVLYSAWVDLCEAMSSATSLHEVIACHEAYLVSIQRQCLVAPDKLWTLIAGRVKTILGLALNYYSIQRVLSDGVEAPAVSAKFQFEIERVEKQFDECMVFLMRVLSFKLNIGHFPHLADLVTRINYNFHYMTEDGQLSTPVSESVGQTPRRALRRV